MTLSETQLWSLLLIVPALVSGFVSAAVAFLLARLHRKQLFQAAARLFLLFTTYGLIDGILAWTPHDLGSPWFLALALFDFLLMGCLVVGIGNLVSLLLGRPWSWILRVVSRIPLGFAVALVPFVLLTLPAWSPASFFLAARLLLGSVFLAALLSGIRLIVNWKEIRDRVYRRILIGTGTLLVSFVPVFAAEVFGGLYLLSFYGFSLVWNLGAIVLAARAFFEPAKTPVSSGLFTETRLSECARRFNLTPRETEVASLHAQGYTAKDIGDRLSISPKTVRNHISNLYDKTGAGQRRELLELFRSSGPLIGSVLG